jgi:serine/threonine-protein kinase RsbW
MPERSRGNTDPPFEPTPELTSLLLSSAPPIVWTWDPDTGCTFASDAWSRILGRDPLEAHGEGWAASVHPEDADSFHACREAMNRNEPFAAEYRLRRADGSYAVLNDQGFPMRAGSEPGPFLGAALEVTDQREDERSGRSRAERLDRVTRALSSSTTVEEAADAVFDDALGALGAPFGGLGLASPDGRTLSIDRLRGFEVKRQSWRAIPVDDDLPVTRAFRERRSAFYPSTDAVVRAFPDLQGELLPYQARAAMPLRVDGQVLGVLYVAFDEAREFDSPTRAYFEEVADRIAHALERARVFDAARRSEVETHALQRVTADLAAAISVEDVERVTTRSARDAVGADACLLGLIDVELGRVVYADTDAYPSDLRDLLPTSLEAGTSPVADVAASGRSRTFETSEQLIDAYPALAGLLDRLPYRARAFVPVFGSGVTLGVLVASSARPGRFTADGVRLLDAIGSQCGQSLERARLYRDAEDAAHRAGLLQAASLSMAEAIEIDEIAEHAVSFAVDLVGAEIGALLVIDPDHGRLAVAREVGAPRRLLERWADTPLRQQPVFARSIESRRARWLSLGDLRSVDPTAADDIEPLGATSLSVVPLVSAGEVLGFLVLARSDPALPTPEHREVLVMFGERVAAAVHRANLLDAERRTRRELERALSRLSRLQAVSAAISQAIPVQEVADTALDASMEAFNATGGGVYLPDGEVLRCVAARGVFTSAAAGTLEAIPITADMAMCAAFAGGHVGWVPTEEEWRRRYPDGAALFDGVARSSIAIPFVVEDRVLGVMTLVFRGEEVLDRPERRLARTIGHQAAVALERSLLHEREMARSRRTERLQQLIAELATSTTPVGVAASLTSSELDVVSATGAAVLLVDESDGRIELAAARGYPPEVIDALVRIEDAPGRAAIATQRPSFLTSAEAIAERHPDLAGAFGEALAEMPMLVRGEAVGAIVLSFDRARPFDLEQIDMLAAIASEAAQATQRARVTQREREISRTLQASLLPDEPTSSWKGASVATWYSAGTDHLDVGGDWYDAIELPNGKLGVSIGDVVGRGLRAAASMGQLRSALRGLALQLHGPGATLEALNRFAEMTSGTELATVAYGEFDPVTATFTYACAGHPPPVACIGGTVRLLDEGRSPLLAAGYDGRRPEATVALPPGSTLVLYTDGLVERRDEPFHVGIERLRATLADALDQELPQMAETLIETLLLDQDRSDDAAVLCLRTGIPTSFSMAIPGVADELRLVRQRLRGWLTVRRSSVGDTEALVLAVNEAVANAIEHGYRETSGMVEVRGDSDGDLVEITIADRGSWREEEPDHARGRGMSLMRTLVDEVEVRPSAAGTTVVLRHTLEDGRPTRPPLVDASDQR